jgi:hypothetical protein
VNGTSPRPKISKARSPYAVQLTRIAGGAYEALSSDGVSTYRLVQVDGFWQCECRGFLARQTCCHSLAAALPRCYWCLSTEQIALYRNPYQPNEPLELCASCAGA